MIRNYILKSLLLYISIYNVSYAELNNCPTSNGSLDYKIWVDKRSKFTAYASSIVTATSKPIKVIDDVSPLSINAAQLCNGNYVITKENQFGSFGQRPTRISGIVFNPDFMEVKKEFDFPNINGAQFGSNVASLTKDRFVVILTTQSSDTRTLYFKLFSDDGVSLSKAMDVVKSNDINGENDVAGLPNGDFVVTWNQFKKGTFMKLFDNNGRPLTKNIKINIDSLLPHIYLTDNNINIFFENNHERKKNYMFEEAQSFNLKGEPISERLITKDIISMPGYQVIVEKIVDRVLDLYTPWIPGKCDSYDARLIAATDMLKYTKIDEKKEIFSNYCNEQ